MDTLLFLKTNDLIPLSTALKPVFAEIVRLLQTYPIIFSFCGRIKQKNDAFMPWVWCLNETDCDAEVAMSPKLHRNLHGLKEIPVLLPRPQSRPMALLPRRGELVIHNKFPGLNSVHRRKASAIQCKAGAVSWRLTSALFSNGQQGLLCFSMASGKSFCMSGVTVPFARLGDAF